MITVNDVVNIIDNTAHFTDTQKLEISALLLESVAINHDDFSLNKISEIITLKVNSKNYN